MQPEGLGILGFIYSFHMPGFVFWRQSRGRKELAGTSPFVVGSLRRVPPGLPS